MDTHNNLENDFSELRRKAKEKLNSVEKKSMKGSVAEIEHELNVHKIELEMQNEELLSTQSKLVKSIEEYAGLFDYAPVGYFILDKDGAITNANKTGAAQLGITKKQLIGKHLSVFLNSKSYQDNYYRHRSLVIELEKSQQFECEIKKVDGSVFFALIDSTIMKDEKNNFKYLFSTIIDISIQKQHERKTESALITEQELNEMKSRFITFASHEFRTPLAAILTSAEILEKYNKPADEEKKEKHFSRIKAAIQRLNEILIDFMSAGEIEKEKRKNNPEIFNLVKFTENLIEEIKLINGTRNVKYSHFGEYKNVFLDKELLKTVLTNLIVNAYKFSPEGGIIEIITEQETPQISNITIKNRGAGIPENDQPHLFKTFFRAKNADNIQGIGLGLNITQQLITIMGGSISFTSNENEGTVFYVKFLKD